MDITNSTVTEYLNSFYRNSNEGLTELRKNAESEDVPIILRDTENFLSMILELYKPKNVLEIGTAVGYSSSFFVDSCGCKVTSLELDEEMFIMARKNIKNLGFSDNIKVKLGDAQKLLQEMIDDPDRGEDDKFDMVFIDAAKSHYKAFWELAMPLITDKALIICDNVLMKASTAFDESDVHRRFRTSHRKMRSFLEFISDVEYAKTNIFSVGDGISVSVIDKNKINE